MLLILMYSCVFLGRILNNFFLLGQSKYLQRSSLEVSQLGDDWNLSKDCILFNVNSCAHQWQSLDKKKPSVSIVYFFSF
jgi:hypothetical protein